MPEVGQIIHSTSSPTPEYKGFCVFIFSDFETGCSGWPQIHYVTENDLEFLNLLSLPLSAGIKGKPKNFFLYPSDYRQLEFCHMNNKIDTN